MTDPFEVRYEDVLQNIEFAIVSVYREQPHLADSNVDRVLEGLIRLYMAQMNQRPSPALTLAELDQTVLDRVRSVCEWRLGYMNGPQPQAGATPFKPEPISLEELVVCLKRIRKSVSSSFKPVTMAQ